jgi:hypothetical protein
MKKIILLVSLCVFILFAGNAFAGTYNNASANADANAGAYAGGSTSGANVDSHDINNSVDKNFVNPGITPIPGTNGFFMTPTPDSSFRSVKELLYIVTGDYNATKIYLSEDALNELAKGGDVVSHLQVLRGHGQVPRAYTKGYKGVKWLCIAIEKPVVVKGKLVGTQPIKGLRNTGSIDAEADDANTNSFQVIGDAAKKALKDGNNYMVITKENRHRMADASGWSIGGHGTVGNISNSGTVSVLGGGGSGYSHDQATPEDKPWVHGYVGVNLLDPGFPK